MLGGAGQSCYEACATFWMEETPLASPGWPGWPTSASKLAAILAQIPGGAAACSAYNLSAGGASDDPIDSASGACYWGDGGYGSASSTSGGRRICPCTPPPPPTWILGYMDDNCYGACQNYGMVCPGRLAGPGWPEWPTTLVEFESILAQIPNGTAACSNYQLSTGGSFSDDPVDSASGACFWGQDMGTCGAYPATGGRRICPCVAPVS